jgi:hypothetical protein
MARPWFLEGETAWRDGLLGGGTGDPAAQRDRLHRHRPGAARIYRFVINL